MSNRPLPPPVELARMHTAFGGPYTYRQIADQFDVSADLVRGKIRRHSRRQIDPVDDPPSSAPTFSPSAAPPPTLDELFRLARDSARMINAADPIFTHQKITIPSGDKPIGILFVSCMHLGSRYAFHERFEDIFQSALGTERLYWASLGDDVEGFLSGFPDASAVTDQAIANPKLQRLMLAGVLEKLAAQHKLLCGCASQHGGDWTRRRAGDDPIKDLYLDHGVPFFDGKALVELCVGGETYRIALAHEFPGNSIYNPNHSQRRAALFDLPGVDVVVQGDKHKYAIQEYSLPPHLFDAGLSPTYMQWLVQVGTAKTGPDKYSIRGWSRGVLEWPILIFRPDRHVVAATRDLTVAKLLLNNDW